MGKIISIVLATLLCAGCDVGFKPVVENKGLYNCENKVTGNKVRFNPEDATLWTGTGGKKLEFLDMLSNSVFTITEKSGWTCIDGAGKEHTE